jgi:DNA-binding transcriptional MocR family regulator
MSDARKKELVQLLASREIPLIEDDIYGDLYFGKSRPRTCKSFDQKGLVLYCSSLSKSLAPGYRIGWTIPGRFRSAVVNHKMIYTVATNSPTQAAIAFFLEKGRYDFHLKKLRKSLHIQCLRYMQAISAYFPEAIRVSRPQGGFVLWIELPATIDSFELYQAAIREKISIAPGSIFSTNQAFSNYIRLGFGTPYNQAIEESLKTLGQLIHKMG